MRLEEEGETPCEGAPGDALHKSPKAPDLEHNCFLSGVLVIGDSCWDQCFQNQRAGHKPPLGTNLNRTTNPNFHSCCQWRCSTWLAAAMPRRKPTVMMRMRMSGSRSLTSAPSLHGKHRPRHPRTYPAMHPSAPHSSGFPLHTSPRPQENPNPSSFCLCPAWVAWSCLTGGFFFSEPVTN